VGISQIWLITAFIWGFAEATLFFIVPDFLLTLAAIKLGWRKALLLILYCLSGALFGGAVMYGLAVFDVESARSIVDHVPLIQSEMIQRVAAEMQGQWLWDMFVGALTGTPYKVYAIAAPGADVSLAMFLLGSVVVRPFRWILTLLLAAGISATLGKAGLGRFVLPLWAAMWIAFYIFYYAILSR